MIPSRTTAPRPAALAVTDVGTRDGRPLLLAHGAGGGVVANFAPLIELLTPTRRLLGVDYPGSGESPAPEGPLGLDQLADALVGAALDAGLERFPVAGISLGSAVAITAAHRHPERVTGLLLSVGFPVADAAVHLFSTLYDDLVATGDPQVVVRALTLLSPGPEVLGGLDPAAAESLVGTLAAGLAGDGGAGALEQVRLATRVDVRGLLGGLQVPTAVYVSGQDRIVLPSSTRALGAGIDDAEVVEYPDAGHILGPAEARRWADDVADFLARRQL